MRIRWAKETVADLERLDAFLRSKSPDAADRAYFAIYQGILGLQDFPRLGRPARDAAPHYRELLIPFSEGGYLVLYSFETDIEILRIRHQREDDF
jgi:plasmid stabilization system protein ParE